MSLLIRHQYLIGHTDFLTMLCDLKGALPLKTVLTCCFFKYDWSKWVWGIYCMRKCNNALAARSSWKDINREIRLIITQSMLTYTWLVPAPQNPKYARSLNVHEVKMMGWTATCSLIISCKMFQEHFKALLFKVTECCQWVKRVGKFVTTRTEL